MEPDFDLEKDLQLLKSSGSGKKVCSKCLKTYNNRAIPEFCECGKYLRGKFVPKEKKDTDPHLITVNIASVRTNVRGTPTRTFVNVSNNKVK